MISCGIVLWSGSLFLTAQEREIIEPFESSRAAEMTDLDRALKADFPANGVEWAPNCSDAIFVRRVYLDLLGRLPPANAVKAFVRDREKAKRAILIDQLLASDDFSVYWAMKWSDLLRVKSEFPINLWPNAAQAYHEWIYNSLRENKPYDVFARELLTSSGSNFRRPAVNFYRAVQGKDAASLARVAAQTFMGVRLENWADAERAALELFFSRVAFKSTAEWKEEIIYVNPELYAPLTLVPPFSAAIQMPSGGDPREVFADWLITPKNRWFARNQVNRQWAWLMGRGIVHEPDDFGPHNPASHPKLLRYLETELLESDYDMRHIYALILKSRCYQQSAIPSIDEATALVNFVCYPVRRMDAEVLSDVLCELTNTKEEYVSMIPEPYTFIPDDTRTVAIADGSITSAFLELFGRSSRDTGLFTERDSRPTDKQALHLLNSSHVWKKISQSKWVKMLSGGTINYEKLEPVYLTFYSRTPTEAEVAIAEAYASGAGRKRWLAAQDILWAIINSKEFLYNH
ncbi:MAG: DUF1553 domain-containing protein [Opitutaceae bacterium]